jgi:hypothetical protein
MPLPTTFAPSLSAGGGGPSNAGSSAGVNSALSNPFNFDNSGWNVNIHSNGASLSARGNEGANDTSQAASGAGGGGALGALGGIDPLFLLIGAAAFLLLK